MISNSNRTRVIATRGSQVLFVKGRFGSHQWSLPGGGIHRNESPEVGAARELAEETGIKVDSKQLALLGRGVNRKSKRNFYNHWLYRVEVKTEEVLPQRFEILEVAWFPKSALPTNISAFTRLALKQYLGD